MTRDQFIRRVSDLLTRAGTDDAPLLVRMLEVNCLGIPQVESTIGAGDPNLVVLGSAWNDIEPAFAKREAASEEVLALLRSNEASRYVRAVKRFRELTGDALHEAKRMVDFLMRVHGITREQLAAPRTITICAAMDCTGELRAIPGGVGNAWLIGYQCAKCGANYATNLARIPANG